MSVNSKMTAIADKIRVLSGTTGTMGLDDMATHVGEANENVDTEASLISQIAAALEGKAGGGSTGSGGVETCTVVVKPTADTSPFVPTVYNVYYTVYENGSQQYKKYAAYSSSTITIENIVVGSIVMGTASNMSVWRPTNATKIDAFCVGENFGFAITSNAGGTATLTIS